MRDGDHCGLSAMILYRVVDTHAPPGIECARCLVEEQEPWPQEKYLGKDELLLLAPRQKLIPALTVTASL